jgi:hypothetical protein
MDLIDNSKHKQPLAVMGSIVTFIFVRKNRFTLTAKFV